MVKLMRSVIFLIKLLCMYVCTHLQLWPVRDVYWVYTHSVKSHSVQAPLNGLQL